MIHFTCEHCRKSVHVDDRYGGMKGRCPHCKQTVAIPAANDALIALTAAFGAGHSKQARRRVQSVDMQSIGRSLLAECLLAVLVLVVTALLAGTDPIS